MQVHTYVHFCWGLEAKSACTCTTADLTSPSPLYLVAAYNSSIASCPAYIDMQIYYLTYPQLCVSPTDNRTFALNAWLMDKSMLVVLSDTYSPFLLRLPTCTCNTLIQSIRGRTMLVCPHAFGMCQSHLWAICVDAVALAAACVCVDWHKELSYAWVTCLVCRCGVVGVLLGVCWCGCPECGCFKCGMHSMVELFP